MKESIKLTTLAGGCFWCTEAVFEELRGVRRASSGYAGGSIPSPTYQQVCGGDTGHAEVVQIEFDENVVSFETLLRVFFLVHDPTQTNRQGNDVGSQYRSAIFYHDKEQRAVAEKYIEKLAREKDSKEPIVTKLIPFEKFYPAEEYHQDYYARNQSVPYCQIIINPKLDKFRKEFKDLLKPQS